MKMHEALADDDWTFAARDRRLPRCWQVTVRVRFVFCKVDARKWRRDLIQVWRLSRVGRLSLCDSPRLELARCLKAVMAVVGEGRDRSAHRDRKRAFG